MKSTRYNPIQLVQGALAAAVLFTSVLGGQAADPPQAAGLPQIQPESTVAHTPSLPMTPAVRQFVASQRQGAATALRGIDASQTGYITWLDLAPGRALEVPGVDADARPESVALSFVESNRSWFANDSASLRYYVKSVQEYAGHTFVRMGQSYAEVPVYDAGIVVRVDGRRRIRSVLCRLLTDTSDLDGGRVSVAPSIGAFEAAHLAEAQLTQSVLADAKPNWREASAAAIAFGAGPAELAIYCPSLLRSEGPMRLVWKADIRNTYSPLLSETVLVDAQDGTIPLHFRTASGWSDRTVTDHLEFDPNNPVHTRTEGSGPVYFDPVDNVFTYLGDCEDFYNHLTGGRNGPDGGGAPILAEVQSSIYGAQYDWEGGLNRFWFGWDHSANEFITVDVVGHEYAHGVTYAQAGLSGSLGAEPGALCEALSDVWGEWFEQWRNPNLATLWILGEDMPNEEDHRSMIDPPLIGGCPDRYLGPGWLGSSESDPFIYHCGGPIRKLGYLLSAGDTFNNFPVTGFGNEGAAHIFYGTLQCSLVDRETDFHGFYRALIRFAEDAVSPGTEEEAYTREQIRDIERACQSVNIRHHNPVSDAATGIRFAETGGTTSPFELDDTGTARTARGIVSTPSLDETGSFVVFRNGQNVVAGIGNGANTSGSIRIKGSLNKVAIPTNASRPFLLVKYQGVAVTTVGESGDLEMWGKEE